MIDWNVLVSWVFPPGFLLTLGVFIFRAWRKRHAGQLTRAAVTTKELAKLTRLYDYIYQLRADQIALGNTPRAWPRGLKPKE